MLSLFDYYARNIAGDISGITRKSTAKNLIGAADFLILKRKKLCQKVLLP